MNHIPAKTYGYASNKDVKFSKYKGICEYPSDNP